MINKARIKGLFVRMEIADFIRIQGLW